MPRLGNVTLAASKFEDSSKVPATTSIVSFFEKKTDQNCSTSANDAAADALSMVKRWANPELRYGHYQNFFFVLYYILQGGFNQICCDFQLALGLTSNKL